MADNSDKKERIRCNYCTYNTWHKLLFRHVTHNPITDKDSDEEIDSFPEIWEIFQCQGCDSLIARVEFDFPWDSSGPEYQFYPERTASHHRKKDYQKLPENLETLYTEVVNSFNNNYLLLCTAGLRSLIEGLCADKGIIEGPNDQGKIVRNLEGKINGLQTIVPPGIVKNLHGLRFLGNQALHELEVPSKTDLELALTVVEDIFNVVYDLDYRSQLLYEKATRPKPGPKPSEEDGNIPF